MAKKCQIIEISFYRNIGCLVKLARVTRALLGVRFDHDITIGKDCCHDCRAEDRVNEDHDGDPTNRMEGRKKEKRIFRMKPVG